MTSMRYPRLAAVAAAAVLLLAACNGDDETVTPVPTDAGPAAEAPVTEDGGGEEGLEEVTPIPEG